MTIKHIPCGPSNKKVCASMDFGDKYIAKRTHGILYPSSVDTSGVIDTMICKGHRMIQDGLVVCNGIQWYAKLYNDTQWYTVELRVESCSHLIVQGYSI